MACLFEYAILPITVENLLDLSGSDEAFGCGDFLMAEVVLLRLLHGIYIFSVYIIIYICIFIYLFCYKVSMWCLICIFGRLLSLVVLDSCLFSISPFGICFYFDDHHSHHKSPHQGSMLNCYLYLSQCHNVIDMDIPTRSNQHFTSVMISSPCHSVPSPKRNGIWISSSSSNDLGK